MKKIYCFLIIIIITAIASTSIGFADSGEENHWANDECIYLKEFITEMKPNILDQKDIAFPAEDLDILLKEIFNKEKLDTPITVDNWAKLIQIILKLPENDTDKLLEMYVFGLSNDNEIRREDAVGGLVKLLSIDYLDAQVDYNDFQKFKAAIKDTKDISEKQNGLICIAYKKGILDTTVDTEFRPKELLTNAEAISTLYHVVERYNIDAAGDKQPDWALEKINEFEISRSRELQIIKILRGFGEDLGFDQPVHIKSWYLIMEELISLKNPLAREYIKNYTFDLSDDDYIARENALISIMKLVPADPRDATAKELSDAEGHFKDFKDIKDTSKVSQAYTQGLVNGYPDHTFRPKEKITYGEAAIIMIRLLNKEALE